MLRCEWDRASRREWHKLLARAPRCALQQGWAYGEALRAHGVGVHRLVAFDAAGAVVACAQVARRRLLGLLPALFLLRGPVWIRPQPEDALLAAIRARFGRAPLLWAPETSGALPGRRAVVTGYSTSWLALDRPGLELRRGLRGKWRHRLGQAERQGLEVAASPAELGWLLAANEARRREVGYRGPSPAFLAHLATAAMTGGDLLLVTACKAGKPLAGALFVRHGGAATYEVGHVTARGRELGANHLLLWRSLGMLAERSVRWVDLGGIDTERAPGLARFKLGLGGEIATLAGTFLVPPFGFSNSW